MTAWLCWMGVAAVLVVVLIWFFFMAEEPDERDL